MVARLAWMLLISLASRAVSAAPCDAAAEAEPARDHLAKGDLLDALGNAEVAARKCPGPATYLVLGDAAAELWLRDRALAAYRKAASAGTPEEKEAAKRGQEAAQALGRPPRLEELVREASGKPAADAIEAARLWQRAIAQAEAQRAPTPPTVWSGHTDAVDALAFGGKMVATGSRDRTIKLWDGETGRGIATLTGHADRVTALAFSSDGKLLASAGADRAVRIWEVASRRELRASQSHKNVVSAVAFSSDGRRLASGGWDGRIKLWDAASGLELATLAGHGDSIVQLSFSLDGARLLSVSRDGVLRLWDTSAARLLQSKLPTQKVAAAVFLADGTVAVAQPDGVRRWDLRGKAITRYGSEAVSWLWVDARAMLLGVSGRDTAIIDLATGNTVRRFGVAWPGRGGGSLAPSPDGSRLAWSRGERDAFVGEAGGKLAATLGSVAPPVTALGWVAGAGGGTTLLVGMDERLVAWDLKAAPTRPALRSAAALVAVVKDVLIRRGKKALDVVDLTGAPRGLWDVPASCYDGNELRGAASLLGGDLVLAYRRPPCGERAVHVWTRAAQAPVVAGPREGVQALALAPDGKSVVTVAVTRASSVARPEAELALWPLSGGPARFTRRIAVEPNALAVSKSGVLATGGRQILFWRAATLTRLRSLAGTASAATALAFSPDGRVLASGHADGTVVFWDVASGRRRGVLVVAADDSWAYAAEDGRMDGDGRLISLAIAGAVAPPGMAFHQTSLSPLKR